VSNRSAFGSVLVEQPLMQNLLVDLIVESEAASLTALRMAKAMGDAETNEEEANLFRVGVAVTKYWTTKKQPQFVYECMEAFGGNGYVEDFPLARHFRQSPLNAIWEGSGNVIALDILRAFNQLPALLKECQSVRGQDAAFDRFVKETAAFANSFASDPRGKAVQLSARSIADRLALCLQGATMLKYGDPALTKVFMVSRIASPRAVNYGTLDPALIDPSIISAAMPTKLA
jgi:putative acyl-CoA dehydrogenase